MLFFGLFYLFSCLIEDRDLQVFQKINHNIMKINKDVANVITVLIEDIPSLNK